MANRVIRSRSFASRGSQRRATEWGIFANTALATVAGASDVLLATFSQATLAPVTPGTIVRVRGSVLFLSDQTASDESQFGAIAIGVVSDRAAAAGVASVPVPSATGWGDDVFFMTMALQNQGSNQTGTNARQQVIAQQFDSKAMRKLNDGDALAITCSNWGAGGLNVAISFRILFKKGRS